MTEEVKEHLQTSIFVNFHYLSWYPPCICTCTHTAVSQLYMDTVRLSYSFHKSLQCNGQITGSWWFSKTSSTTCAVFTYSWSAGLKSATFMIDANPILNSLHPLPTRMWPQYTTTKHQQQLAVNLRVEMFCLYGLSHQPKFFCMTLFPLHINLSPK